MPKLHPIRQCFARLRRAPSENSVNIYVPLFLFNLEQLLLALAVSPIPDEQIPEEEYTTSELKQICRALVLFCEQQLALFEVPQMVSLPRKRKRSNLVAKKKKNKKRQLVAPDSNDNESQGDDTEYTIEVIITDEKNHSGNRVYVSRLKGCSLPFHSSFNCISLICRSSGKTGRSSPGSLWAQRVSVRRVLPCVVIRRTCYSSISGRKPPKATITRR